MSEDNKTDSKKSMAKWALTGVGLGAVAGFAISYASCDVAEPFVPSLLFGMVPGAVLGAIIGALVGMMRGK